MQHRAPLDAAEDEAVTARVAPLALVAAQALAEGAPSRVRYFGGEGHGGGCVAEVRETPRGVAVWVNGFRVRTLPTVADVCAMYGVAEADLRGEP